MQTKAPLAASNSVKPGESKLDRIRLHIHNKVSTSIRSKQHESVHILFAAGSSNNNKKVIFFAKKDAAAARNEKGEA